MRKWTIIFSLGLVFISNTSFCQVFKLPLLMEHYKEHKADNEEVTLLEFLYMHYGGNDQTSADDSKDSQLPFKQFDQCLQLSLCHPILKLNLARVILPATGYNYPTFQHSLSESPFKGGTFKPPQSL